MNFSSRSHHVPFFSPNHPYSFLSFARKKIEAWFVSLVKREFYGIEPTIFMSTNWQIKLPTGKINCWTRFLYRCSCFSELVYGSSVLLLMVYSHKDSVGNFSFEGLLCLVYNFEQPYRNICASYLHIH